MYGLKANDGGPRRMTYRAFYRLGTSYTLPYGVGPDVMPFILCQVDFMPFFSREHIRNNYADFPLSSHKRHKIGIYAGSA